MRFQAIRLQTPHPAQSPLRLIEHESGREVGWVNRYPDREYVRRVADTILRTWAYNLLHFVRWWESLHHTGEVRESDLTESTLLDYVKFQSSQQPPPSGSSINDRVATADRALRNEFPDAPCQVARGFHHAFLHRRPLGLGRPPIAWSRLRVRVPKRNLVPLSVEEVARFLVQFPHRPRPGHRGSDAPRRTALRRGVGFESGRLVAFRSAIARAWQRKNKLRFLPLAPETVQLLDHYRRLERPNPCTAALFVSLKGPARGVRMTLAGLRSLFRYHRQRTGVQLANPHRFRHYLPFLTMSGNVRGPCSSRPAFVG